MADDSMPPDIPMRVSPVSGQPCGKHGCTKRSKQRGGELCDGRAVKGTDRCRMHPGTSLAKLKAQGAVRTEAAAWGLGDTTVDPGEVLLRLVTQSAARVELYSRLLGEAFDAGQRLQSALEHGRLLISEPAEDIDDHGQVEPERPDVQTARMDLERIFNTGGVAALIGVTLSDTKQGHIYASGEAVRGLAKLEADERDRCATFAAKAVAAGLAERQVRLAERQGAMLAGVIQAVLGDLGLSAEQRALVPEIVPRRLRELEQGAA